MLTGPMSLEEIVENGLCIGCGLCQSIAGTDTVELVMTEQGRERPRAKRPLTGSLLNMINAVCPGTRIVGPDPAQAAATGAEMDPVWGPAFADTFAIAHASAPSVRYRAAAGGVLTALGQYLLTSGAVAFILHATARADAPMRSTAQISETPEQVLQATASRYGPVAVLAALDQALARNQAFAIIAKPCDIGAVRQYMQHNPRARELIKYCLTLVCGGASDLSKSSDLLKQHGIQEAELNLFRYRGYGNPGPTRVETKTGRVLELSYFDMWADESAWRIQPRCKICPDAIGEVADIVSADCWPGGAPSGEDEGFNAVFARSAKGNVLLQAAFEAGVIRQSARIGFRDMDDYQPHQVRKKRAVWARLEGIQQAGMRTPAVEHLRIAELAQQNNVEVNQHEHEGAYQRALDGRLGEPPVPS